MSTPPLHFSDRLNSGLEPSEGQLAKDGRLGIVERNKWFMAAAVNAIKRQAGHEVDVSGAFASNQFSTVGRTAVGFKPAAPVQEKPVPASKITESIPFAPTAPTPEITKTIPFAPMKPTNEGPVPADRVASSLDFDPEADHKKYIEFLTNRATDQAPSGADLNNDIQASNR